MPGFYNNETQRVVNGAMSFPITGSSGLGWLRYRIFSSGLILCTAIITHNLRNNFPSRK